MALAIYSLTAALPSRVCEHVERGAVDEKKFNPSSNITFKVTI